MARKSTTGPKVERIQMGSDDAGRLHSIWRLTGLPDLAGVTVDVTTVQAGLDMRLAITGVNVRGPGLTSEQLRRVPMGRIDAMVNNADALARRSWSRTAPGDLTLDVPTTRRYPNAFYERLAAMYRTLSASGMPPAPNIAAANNVPVTTVHRWVAEARRRGVLGPARRGAAG
jgi:hypothetical protein